MTKITTVSLLATVRAYEHNSCLYCYILSLFVSEALDFSDENFSVLYLNFYWRHPSLVSNHCYFSGSHVVANSEYERRKGEYLSIIESEVCFYFISHFDKCLYLKYCHFFVRSLRINNTRINVTEHLTVSEWCEIHDLNIET
jgi:hypothetical protein